MHTQVPVPLVHWCEVAAGVEQARAYGMTLSLVCQGDSAVWRVAMGPGRPTLAGRSKSPQEAREAALRVARAAAVDAIEQEAELACEAAFLKEQLQ